jgi:tetratricopeptide (TPR) repeat protein
MSAESRLAIPLPRPRARRAVSARAFGPEVLAALLVVAGALLLYARTAYRTVAFWDAGELIATSAILGIPHQPSTPLYVLLGRLATLLPGGSVAFRVNFLSSVAAALAAGLTVLLTARLAARAGLAPVTRAIAGFISGLLVIGAATLWTSANEAEVYALSTMIAALAAWAIVRASDVPAASQDLRIPLAVTYLLALSIAIHLGTLLVLPPLAWFALRSGSVRLRTLEPKSLALFLLLFLLGMSVHFYLPIRAALDPAINEGDPADWQRFFATLTRAQYPPSNPLLRRGSLAYQFGPMFLHYLGQQWPIVRGGLGGILVPLAGAIGLGLLLRRERRGGELLLLLALIAGPALVLYLNFTEHEVRERDYFFALFFQTVAVLAGLAGGFLLAWLGAGGGRGRGWRAGLAALLLVLLALLPIRHGFRTHDKHANPIARDYAANLLTPLPPSTILFTNGDNDTFPLWYLQEVEGKRKDVRVVNLSLLNTPWYIQQLRDLPPEVPIVLTDSQIEALRPALDERGRVRMVKDFAVEHIVAENRGRRPLYLAVTVPDRMGLDDRLKVEGLAQRIYPEPQGERVDLEVARHNLYEVFTPLHGILTPEGLPDSAFYRDPNETSLVQNYAAIHFYLGVEYDLRGDLAAATREAERALAVSPKFVGNRLFLGLLYEKAADWPRAERHYRASLAVSPGDPRLLHRLGRVLGEEGRSGAAVPILKEAIARGREDYFDPVGSLFEVYWRAGERDSALQVLDQWLVRHPGDQEIRQVRDEAARGGFAPGTGAPAGRN